MLKRDIKGALDRDSLPIILHSLAARKLAGQLILESEGEKIQLCVKDGKVVFAYSNIPYLQVAEFAFEWGFIDLDRYEQIKKGGDDLLLLSNSLKEKDLKRLIRKQVREIIFEALSWKRGNYHFSYSECEKRDYIELNLYDLLIRGLVREKDWNLMRKILVPYERVPKFDTSIDPEEAGGIKLTREESYVLRLIDGEKTLYEIIEESKLTDFETARIIFAFVVAGVVIFN